MKELAADESLSEEARESAKKALEVLVSSQLLDIEQAAALKKLESEARFVNHIEMAEWLGPRAKVLGRLFEHERDRATSADAAAEGMAWAWAGWRVIP